MCVHELMASFIAPLLYMCECKYTHMHIYTYIYMYMFTYNVNTVYIYVCTSIDGFFHSPSVVYL